MFPFSQINSQLVVSLELQIVIFLEVLFPVRVRVRGVRSHIHTTLRVIGFGLVWRRDDLP